MAAPTMIGSEDDNDEEEEDADPPAEPTTPVL
jgi:hypothetical protein